MNPVGEVSEAKARHVPSAYVVSALELLAGIVLSFFAATIAIAMANSLAGAGLDDRIALAGIGIAGVCVLAAGAVTLFHAGLSYGLLRGFRMTAIASEALMLAAAGALWVIAKNRGGDWAGLGLLGAMLVGGIATVLLLLSLFGLRALRRLR